MVLCSAADRARAPPSSVPSRHRTVHRLDAVDVSQFNVILAYKLTSSHAVAQSATRPGMIEINQPMRQKYSHHAFTIMNQSARQDTGLLAGSELLNYQYIEAVC